MTEGAYPGVDDLFQVVPLDRAHCFRLVQLQRDGMVRRGVLLVVKTSEESQLVSPAAFVRAYIPYRLESVPPELIPHHRNRRLFRRTRHLMDLQLPRTISAPTIPKRRAEETNVESPPSQP